MIEKLNLDFFFNIENWDNIEVSERYGRPLLKTKVLLDGVDVIYMSVFTYESSRDTTYSGKIDGLSGSIGNIEHQQKIKNLYYAVKSKSDLEIKNREIRIANLIANKFGMKE